MYVVHFLFACDFGALTYLYFVQRMNVFALSRIAHHIVSLCVVFKLYRLFNASTHNSFVRILKFDVTRIRRISSYTLNLHSQKIGKNLNSETTWKLDFVETEHFQTNKRFVQKNTFIFLSTSMSFFFGWIGLHECAKKSLRLARFHIKIVGIDLKIILYLFINFHHHHHLLGCCCGFFFFRFYTLSTRFALNIFMLMPTNCKNA